jgi:hypothetical protein
MAERYLKAAYAGLQKSLQQEWQFLPHVVMEGLGEEFYDIKQALQIFFRLSVAMNMLMTP